MTHKRKNLAPGHGGEAEADGEYAPLINGKIKEDKKQYFRKGDPFPNDGNKWIMISSAY